MTPASQAAGPPSPEAMERFLASYFYERAAFLIDEVRRIDPDSNEVDAVMDTRRPLLYAPLQRGEPGLHPRHVSGSELVMLTANLGSLHAYFVHGCRWDQGWVGYGTHIHRADFKRLVRIGPPLVLHSTETRSRLSPSRLVCRYRFRFEQEDEVVYLAEQSAHFVKGPAPG